MCQVASNIMDALTKTVKQFLDEGRMFTAYDVTIETRQRDGMFLRHSDVGGAVHEVEALVDALDYGHDQPGKGTIKWGRYQMTMPGNGWAWVYHPSYLDPQQYQPKTGKPAGSVAVPANTKPTQSPTPVPAMASISLQDGNTNDSGGEQDDGSFATDYRNRLFIPTRFLKEAGLTAGDEVEILSSPQDKSILIIKQNGGSPPSQVVITTQTVERNGDLRLSSRTLKAADITGNSFMIENNDNGSCKFVKVSSK